MSSCDTCDDTGRMTYMIEMGTQALEPDEDWMVPCVDCTHAATRDESAEARGGETP